MIQEFSGETLGPDGSVAERRFAIVVSSYHHNITGNLLDGARETLLQREVPEQNIEILWAPGAWEIPTATQFALETRRFDAVLTLGCVIRGETTHDQHINTTVATTLGRLSVDYQTPIAFGVLTCNSMEQAIARSGGEVGNKGVETANAAIHMLLLKAALLG